MRTHTSPRAVTVVALLMACAVALSGCGARYGVAHDGSPEPASVSTGTADPQASGAWPAYGVENYSYTLRIGCFCIDRGVPVTVTVRDGKVVDAVYVHKGIGHAAGAPAAQFMRVTINDIIDAANTRHAYQVKVRWPDGQDYPTSVWVDKDANMADEEIGYSIHHVTVAQG
jgi:hypothetical protein